MANIRALFVDTHNAMRDSGGGVQLCNQEFLSILSEAGFSISKLPFGLDRRLWTRIKNRIQPQVRPGFVPEGLIKTVSSTVAEMDAHFIFFGLTRFLPLSKHLRESFPHLKQVLLSHGTEFVDFSINQRVRYQNSRTTFSHYRTAKMLGEEVLREIELRKYLDAALVLSPFEAELEKWLGTPYAQWVPRTVIESKLVSNPTDSRVGCVATLDHPPNYQGLDLLLKKLAEIVPKDFRFRLVGTGQNVGRKLKQDYPFVEYLGRLNDADLRKEASTWCCFVHPLFLNAKGCSTKLAVGLGWGIPIATTELGARGYKWNNDECPLADSPDVLARYVLDRSRKANFEKFSSQTRRIVSQTPTKHQLAREIREFLIGDMV